MSGSLHIRGPGSSRVTSKSMRGGWRVLESWFLSTSFNIRAPWVLVSHQVSRSSWNYVDPGVPAVTSQWSRSLQVLGSRQVLEVSISGVLQFLQSSQISGVCTSGVLVFPESRQVYECPHQFHVSHKLRTILLTAALISYDVLKFYIVWSAERYNVFFGWWKLANRLSWRPS